MKRVAIVAAVLTLALFGIYVAFPGLTLQAAMRLERGAGNLVQKTVRVADHEIVYLEAGQGETVLLVHGFGGDKDNWTRFARHLPGYRLLALDLPGFGESDRLPQASYDVTSQVERLHAFATAVNAGRVHIIGNSMGGHIAAAYAARFSGETSSLALLNAAGVTSPKPSELAVLLEKGTNPLVVRSADDYDALLRFTFVEPPFLPSPVKQYFAGRAVQHAEFNAKVFADLRARPYPLESVLSQMRVPAFILWGDTDRLIHPMAATVFADGLPDPRQMIIMKDTGHLPMIERPADTAEAYLAFLQSLRK